MDEKQKKILTDAAAAERKALRTKLVADCQKSVGEAAALLKGADDTVTDETRIAVMNKLREAIHHINEAG